MNQVYVKNRGAVIVTRVSTGEQVKHGTSLESQLDICRQKAQALSLPIVAEYEDAGISGGLLLLREGMQSAIADIKAGRASMLICANMSRYSRDVEHQQSIRKEVRAAGGMVVFCDMEFADTPEGDLAFSIMGGFAEYERKAIRARTMRGKRKRAEEGQQPSRSRAPYGYHIVTHADITRGTFGPEMLGRYIIRDDTAPIAKRIIESYAFRGYSLPKICLELNTERVPTPANGNAWHPTTLHVILRNPVYKGQPVAQRVRSKVDEQRIGQISRVNGRSITTAEARYEAPESEWITLSAPPIVDEATWNAVQSKLPNMKLYGGGNPKQLRMLSGLTYCPHCGARMRARVQFANRIAYNYYLCSNRVNSRTQIVETNCTGDLYGIERTEQAAIAAISDAVKRPEAISAAVRAYRDQPSSRAKVEDTAAELAKIDKALAKLRESEAAAIQGQIAGIRAGASPDAYAEVFADIAVQRKDLENQRGVIARLRERSGDTPASPRRETTTQTWQRALSDTLQVLGSENVEGAEKRALVGAVVEKVVCHKEGGDVYFLPGTFGDTEEDEASRSTFQTTCIGIKTQK